MRRLVVLVVGLLVLGACGSVPKTETHEVLFHLDVVNPVAYADLNATFGMGPLAEEEGKAYGASWSHRVTIHYPDVTNVWIDGEIVLNGKAVGRDPAAEIAEVRCRIEVDDVLVAEYVGRSALCVHRMTAGMQRAWTPA